MDELRGIGNKKETRIGTHNISNQIVTYDINQNKVALYIHQKTIVGFICQRETFLAWGVG